MQPPSGDARRLHFAGVPVQPYRIVDKPRHCFYFLPMDDARIWDDEVDAAGLLCPLPVLKARKRLKSMSDGTVLRLIATDPAAVIDVPHFCSEAGHGLIAAHTLDDRQIYLIRKGG